MSKRYNIKWRASDEEDLKRAVRNFNAKVTRLAKKSPEIATSLPEKMSYKELKEVITTRQDLKREINALKRFSKKGAETLVEIPESEYNIKITSWQYKEMVKRGVRANKARAERRDLIENLEVVSAADVLSAKQAGIANQYIRETEPLNVFTAKQSKMDIKKKFKTLLYESQIDVNTKKDYQMKANYLKGIAQTYGKEGERVYNAIKDMSPQQFIKIFNSNVNASFEFASKLPNENLKSSYLSELESVWTPKTKE